MERLVDHQSFSPWPRAPTAQPALIVGEADGRRLRWRQLAPGGDRVGRPCGSNAAGDRADPHPHRRACHAAGDAGGIIHLKRTGRRIRFQIDLDRARASRLVLSSQVLALATKVVDSRD
ncbi:MAG: YfiR family protein [Krumholzibacteria bacterium]|nr:YfiR family protein [Candidatus Krumholzibacteria bacterium]